MYIVTYTALLGNRDWGHKLWNSYNIFRDSMRFWINLADCSMKCFKYCTKSVGVIVLCLYYSYSRINFFMVNKETITIIKCVVKVYLHLHYYTNFVCKREIYGLSSCSDVNTTILAHITRTGREKHFTNTHFMTTILYNKYHLEGRIGSVNLVKPRHF